MPYSDAEARGAPDGWQRLVATATEWSREGETILLVRHSIREHIREPSIEAAVRAQLTDEGRALARSFGSRLPVDRRARIFSSPVGRCVDTAERIAEGLAEAGGAARFEGKRGFLGGDFVRDPKPVIRTFVGSGTRGFLEAWHEGLFPEDVVLPPERAGRDLLSKLLALREPADEPHLDLHAAHDLTVIALVGLAFEVTGADAVPWPGYMEGAALRVEGSTAHLWYAGREASLTV